MNEDQKLLGLTRRHLFRNCGVGIGKLALMSLINERVFAARHHAPKIESVIYCFMAGGPSHLELFDYKPELVKWDAKPTPDSYLAGKRFAFMDSFTKEKPKLLGTRRQFKQWGKSGTWVSDLFPHIGAVADDLTMLHGVCTENFNHGPAKLFSNTGSFRPGRPSIGSWVTYGIGSESKDLPGFVVLQSGPRGPRGGALLWGSGFLPTAYQGIPFRNVGDPILDLSSPKGITTDEQRQTLDTIQDLNKLRYEDTADEEIKTRISAYEMAYRMQTSGPELIDFSKETKETLDMYGAKPGEGSYANNCLLARRLVERGVRFIQLYHTDWDHHDDITKPLDTVCAEVDKPSAALVRDLKNRGLLDKTLVVWGGEFGRTPMGEVREKGKIGRNHHIDSYSIFMAGGGIKPGITVGGSDELGFSPVEEKIEIHDIHATILHLLGIDHLKLTYKFQGREFRLTDVRGKLIKKMLT